MRKIDLIVLHCSASSLISQRAATIRAWHTERGFTGPDGIKGTDDDIGYHFFIGFDGKIEEGRALEAIGAHAEGHNANSIGICLAGLEVKDFSTHQFIALRLLLKLLKPQFRAAKIIGHSEIDKHGKTCPVFNVQPLKDFWAALP